MTRDSALTFVVPFSVISAAASLIFAVYVRFYNSELLNPYGYIVLGLWVIVPPAWFLYEWTLCAGFDEPELSRIKHYHELARNLWLALLLVLAALMGAEEVFRV